jgi:hypothetical protein
MYLIGEHRGGRTLGIVADLQLMPEASMDQHYFAKEMEIQSWAFQANPLNAPEPVSEVMSSTALASPGRVSVFRMRTHGSADGWGHICSYGELSRA